jgi:hypothetical protein
VSRGDKMKVFSVVMFLCSTVFVIASYRLEIADLLIMDTSFAKNIKVSMKENSRVSIETSKNFYSTYSTYFTVDFTEK